MTSIRVCAALLVLATACARTDSAAGDSAAATSGSSRAATAAMVSNAIAANPAAADSILQANGMTAQEFDRMMYEIAADSSESAAYAAAKKM